MVADWSKVFSKPNLQKLQHDAQCKNSRFKASRKAKRTAQTWNKRARFTKADPGLSPSTPLGLLRNVWFHTTLYWCRKGREGQRRLTASSFTFMHD